jgi:hypothetical protein
MTMEKIKLIWDLRGPEAEGTAKHHAVHLGQFAKKEQIDSYGHGHEQISTVHSIAFLIVERKDMVIVRDALRPNRAILA